MTHKIDENLYKTVFFGKSRNGQTTTTIKKLIVLHTELYYN